MSSLNDMAEKKQEDLKALQSEFKKTSCSVQKVFQLLAPGRVSQFSEGFGFDLADKALQSAAEDGDLDAQYRLGRSYYYGDDGAPQDGCQSAA